MPISKEQAKRYPPNWRNIAAKILARAGDRCEFPCRDGRRCDAPNGELVFRDKRDPERWRLPNGNDCGDSDPDAYGVTIVLTTAHLNHVIEDCRDNNLKAGCQLHHLRHDASQHADSARSTRSTRKSAGGLFP